MRIDFNNRYLYFLCCFLNVLTLYLYFYDKQAGRSSDGKKLTLTMELKRQKYRCQPFECLLIKFEWGCFYDFGSLAYSKKAMKVLFFTDFLNFIILLIFLYR